ncbi:MAG: tellurite resistance TerB C-terminal domain-containing protein [Dendronalium sp. ChiSLP03b]|nr:tellurite resistance TerB C-terminal domain-containing protein [Dendronalium sp. ChiSLP03b]MDZ8207695.1 tellurite resistance TerB C-terminal domain-containing protein [Dendronalium sp. ChiSLP03b]
MSLRTNDPDNLTTLKTSNMQTVIVSNRFILGIIAFSVSFGLSLVPNWDFNRSFITGVITVIATYAAALFVDKRRRNYEMLVLSSLRKRIKEMEGLKSRIVKEINQIEEHRSLLYTESKQLQNQILECRNQRDSLHRELGNFAGQKKQLEAESSNLKAEVHTLENHKSELNNSFSNLTTEKRRLELHCNTYRSEISQLQNKICEIQQEKQELESNLTLLGRLKPQLEEKLYELRIKLQDLEIELNQQNQLLAATKLEKDNTAASLNSLHTQIVEQQTELEQLQGEFSLLQEERDLLQTQVWDLLQQTETLNQETLPETTPADEIELFPFSELVEPITSTDITADRSESLPEEWANFMEKLPGHEIQVLKAVVAQDNTNALLKQIAEAHITMPNLLIDSINECANDTIGELIIEPSVEVPKVYQEHITNVRKMLDMYEDLMARHASSN